MFCIKILKYFLPILLAFFSGTETANYNVLIYSITSVSFFLCVHYIVNIEHNNDNRLLFFGIFAFIIFDLQKSGMSGVSLIPFCLSSAIFCYLIDKKCFSYELLTMVVAMFYTICSSFISYCVSNYLDIRPLVVELFLLAVIFVVMFLFYSKLNKENEINYIQFY